MVIPCSSDSTLQSFDLLGGFVDQRDDPMQGRFVDIVAAEAVHQHLAQIAHRAADRGGIGALAFRSEEHTSELQSLMRISYAVFCLKKKKATYYNCNLQQTINYTQ